MYPLPTILWNKRTFKWMVSRPRKRTFDVVYILHEVQAFCCPASSVDQNSVSFLQSVPELKWNALKTPAFQSKIKYSFPLPHWLSTTVSLRTNPLSVKQSVSQWPLQQIIEHLSIHLQEWNISEIGPFNRPKEDQNLPLRCLYYCLWIFDITFKLHFLEQNGKKNFPAHNLYLVL